MRIILDRKLARNVQLYILCAGVFVIGYVVGILQNSVWCRDTIPAPPATPKILHSAFLVVVIFTAPRHLDRRQAVRQTWLLTGKGLDVFHFFVVGSSSLDSRQLQDLTQENSEHRDLLILESVSDSFSELSHKLREALKWLDSNVEFKFMLKVDDDSFVRLDALHTNLLQHQMQEELYWGFFDGQAEVKTKGKWKEDTWFLCDRYLPYAKGGGYVVSRALVRTLAGVADHLTLYRNEDVSLGTWLAPFIVQRVHDPRFDTEYSPRGCSNSYLVTHKQTPAMMFSKYANLVVTKQLCSFEYKTRNSYKYDWKSLPSQCCTRNDSTIP